MSAKTIRDAVHGDMRFNALQMAVVDTPPFQRMRGIKQLGTSSLVFPCATHTRFEHSLGTCHMAKKMLIASREHSGNAHLLEEHEPAFFLAALLHDITHIPFGHTFEDERRIFPRHDESQQRLDHFLTHSAIGEILDAEGLLSAVIAILDKQSPADGPVRLMREMIAGPVCADLLDYLKRDAFFCGLGLDYDERLFAYLTTDDCGMFFNLRKNGLFRPDALSELIHLLRLRYTLTERVYYHHGKVASGAMISRALELALDHGHITEEELFDLRDDSFLALLNVRCAADPDITCILDDLDARRFYQPVYLLRSEGSRHSGLGAPETALLEARFHLNAKGERASAEDALAKALGLQQGEVIFYCPSADMALKEANVRVNMDGGQPVCLDAMKYPEIEVLLEKHRLLWRLGVYLRRGCEALSQKAGHLCEEIIGHPNMLES